MKLVQFSHHTHYSMSHGRLYSKPDCNFSFMAHIEKFFIGGTLRVLSRTFSV